MARYRIPRRLITLDLLVSTALHHALVEMAADMSISVEQVMERAIGGFVVARNMVRRGYRTGLVSDRTKLDFELLYDPMPVAVSVR